jgi:hypothetical protein
VLDRVDEGAFDTGLLTLVVRLSAVGVLIQKTPIRTFETTALLADIPRAYSAQSISTRVINP